MRSDIWSVATTRIGYWTWTWSTRQCRVEHGKICFILRLSELIRLMLLMWKWMGLFLRKNHLLRCWGWLSLPNWIEALTLSRGGCGTITTQSLTVRWICMCLVPHPPQVVVIMLWKRHLQITRMFMDSKLQKPCSETSMLTIY